MPIVLILSFVSFMLMPKHQGDVFELDLDDDDAEHRVGDDSDADAAVYADVVLAAAAHAAEPLPFLVRDDIIHVMSHGFRRSFSLSAG